MITVRDKGLRRVLRPKHAMSLSRHLDLQAMRQLGDQLNAMVASAIEEAVQQIGLDSRTPPEEFTEGARWIFAQLYQCTGDSELALTQAVAWLESHPILRRRGPAAHVDSWFFYHLPDEYRYR